MIYEFEVGDEVIHSKKGHGVVYTVSDKILYVKFYKGGHYWVLSESCTKLKEKTMQETKSNQQPNPYQKAKEPLNLGSNLCLETTLPNNSNRKEFAVGDTVYCAVFGKGKVHKVCGRSNLSLSVVFYSGEEALYTMDGRFSEYGNRTLSFSPASIVAGDTEKPFKSELVGKEVILELKDSLGMEFFKVLSEDENHITFINKYGNPVYFRKIDIAQITILGEKITF